MTKLFKEIYDCQTGQLEQIPLTDEEIAIWQLEAEKNLQIQEEVENERILRKSVLEKLGLTEDEAKVLLG